ncbi:MAG: MFS transporter [bacterium]|nr:MFS transporter [bacterium]
MKDSPKSLRSTFRISITEGIFAQIFLSLLGPGSVFLTKFGVMLGALPMHFGILSAIGQFSQIFQPLGLLFTRSLESRKKAVIKIITVGRFLGIFYGILPLLFPEYTAIWIFLFLFLCSTSIQAIGGNAWIAWIADIIPLRIRGRFFAVRTQFLMFAGLITGIIGSLFIDLFEGETSVLAVGIRNFFNNPEFFQSSNLKYSFLIVFFLAVTAGIIGLFILNKQYEKKKDIETGSIKGVLKESFSDSNFRRLLFFGMWWMFTVGIGSPFWQPFMIKNLGMSMFYIQIYGIISTFTSLLFLKFWGKLIDYFGNKTSMRIAIVLGGLNPLVWVFASRDVYWFIFVEAVTSGIMWAGASVVMTNFVLAIAPEKNRQIYSGIFGAATGFAMMTTMLLSGILFPPAMKILGFSLESEQVLFALTGITRWSAQIPISFVNEPHGKSVGSLITFTINFTKV